MRPELARVPGAGTIEVQASDTREIEVVLDPAKLAGAGLTVVDVSDALKAQNTLAAGRPLRRSRACSTWRWRPASGRTSIEIAAAPVQVEERRDDPRRATSAR